MAMNALKFTMVATLTIAANGSELKGVAGRGLFAGAIFSPIIPALYDKDTMSPNPASYMVRDFTSGMSGLPTLEETGFAHDVGRYNERRLAMYETDLFGASDPWANEGDARDIHVGIDVGGPAGTAVHAAASGVIHSCGYNAAPGDYGNVIVTEHYISGRRVWMLYGHLDAASTADKKPGDLVTQGEVLGALGNPSENGGWPPHVHFQLSLVEPETHDLPGVVSSAQHDEALTMYPDPRMVMGRLYEGDGLFQRAPLSHE